MTPKIAEVVKSAPRLTPGNRNVKAIKKRIVNATIVKMLRISVGASILLNQNAKPKKRELRARTNRYPTIPTSNSFTVLTIVSAEGEGLSPIRCSRSALTSPANDQNRYVASKAIADATRKRTILLVKRGPVTGRLCPGLKED